MKNVLVIGGAGYVGTVLSSHCLKKDYKITVLDNLIYDNQFSQHGIVAEDNYNFINGDLRDLDKLNEVFTSEEFTDVVILAGLVGDPITKAFPEASEAINDKGIKNCIDYFDDKKINSLVFVSTCSNYGLIKDDELADEEFELNPLSLYAKAKVSGELHLMSKKGKVDYTGVVLRFATAFGISPRMRFDLSVSEFVKEVYFGNELVVFDEHTWRPYCHIKDFSRLIDIVINADKSKIDFQVFNAGGEVNNFTKKMIVDAIVDKIPNAKIAYNNNGGDPRNYKVNFNKVKSILGFEPQYTVQDGIAELINGLENGLYSDAVENKGKYGNYDLMFD